jgi:hypothetical protein
MVTIQEGCNIVEGNLVQMDRSSGNDGNTFFMEQEFEQIAYSIQMF